MMILRIGKLGIYDIAGELLHPLEEGEPDSVTNDIMSSKKVTINSNKAVLLKNLSVALINGYLMFIEEKEWGRYCYPALNEDVDNKIIAKIQAKLN